MVPLESSRARSRFNAVLALERFWPVEPPFMTGGSFFLPCPHIRQSSPFLSLPFSFSHFDVLSINLIPAQIARLLSITLLSFHSFAQLLFSCLLPLPTPSCYTQQRVLSPCAKRCICALILFSIAPLSHIYPYYCPLFSSLCYFMIPLLAIPFLTPNIAINSLFPPLSSSSLAPSLQLSSASAPPYSSFHFPFYSHSLTHIILPHLLPLTIVNNKQRVLVTHLNARAGRRRHT